MRLFGLDPDSTLIKLCSKNEGVCENQRSIVKSVVDSETDGADGLRNGRSSHLIWSSRSLTELDIESQLQLMQLRNHRTLQGILLGNLHRENRPVLN